MSTYESLRAPSSSKYDSFHIAIQLYPMAGEGLCHTRCAKWNCQNKLQCCPNLCLAGEGPWPHPLRQMEFSNRVLVTICAWLGKALGHTRCAKGNCQNKLQCCLNLCLAGEGPWPHPLRQMEFSNRVLVTICAWLGKALGHTRWSQMNFTY